MQESNHDLPRPWSLPPGKVLTWVIEWACGVSGRDDGHALVLVLVWAQGPARWAVQLLKPEP